MKPCYLILFAISILSSCNSSNDKKQRAAMQDSTLFLSDTTVNDTVNATHPTTTDRATYFILIADTSQDYYVVNKKMYQLSQTLKIPVDTMGRYFNKAKNLIALPDDDEDEMYAGQYFQRRFPSVSFSLEYLYYYQKSGNEKTIALVGGIFETQNEADSMLVILKGKEIKSYLIKAAINLGDVH